MLICWVVRTSSGQRAVVVEVAVVDLGIEVPSVGHRLSTAEAA